MEQKKVAKEPKTKKLADPEAVTIDLASRQMIERAHELGIETAFDRAMTMKPCNIGTQGICCKNCGMGNDISELPAAGSAPEWMSEKAISIGHYFVASGVYTVFGVTLPVSGAPVFQNYIFEEFEKLYGGMWDLEVDPIKHARKMIAHIDKKRQALGIDKARDRILVDMAARRDLETG